MSEALKPCPFCGGKSRPAKDYDTDGFGAFYYIECSKCRSRSGSQFAKETCGIFHESVRNAWNTRADLTEARLRQVAEAVREEASLTAYKTCAETRHVTLGLSVSDHIYNINLDAIIAGTTK